MTVWVVVPVKAPGECKTRLAGVLDDRKRRALVTRMLHHVVAVAGAASGVCRVLLLGPSRHGLPEAMRLLPDAGKGLNLGLAGALRIAAAAQVDRVVFLAADLPHLASNDVAILAADGVDLRIATDRRGTGTNALSLPLPAGCGFGFRYGSDSLALHRAEAIRLGLTCTLVRRDTLALDIDLPADLALL